MRWPRAQKHSHEDAWGHEAEAETEAESESDLLQHVECSYIQRLCAGESYSGTVMSIAFARSLVKNKDPEQGVQLVLFLSLRAIVRQNRIPQQKILPDALNL